MDQQYLAPMIYEFTIFLIAFALSMAIGKKWSQKPNKVTSNLFINVFGFCLAILVAAISRVLRLTGAWEIEPGKYLELLAFSACLIALGNYFFLNFSLAIFYPETKKQQKIIITALYLALNLGFCVYAIVTGLYAVDLTNGIWIGLVILSVAVYIFTFISALQLAKKLPNKGDKSATRLIGMSPVLYFFIFLSFFADRLLGGNFTPFYYVAWVFTLFAMACLYMGVFRPQWAIKS